MANISAELITSTVIVVNAHLDMQYNYLRHPVAIHVLHDEYSLYRRSKYNT